MTDMSLLVNGLDRWNIHMDMEDIQKFEKYMDIMLEYNKRMNLTAITDPEDIIVEHFLDSLSILNTGILSKNSSIIDVGTGAGFPGIPIKIALPNTKMILLDSLKKRVDFLDHIVSTLELKEIGAIHGRAEEMGRMVEHREMYDMAFSRAVAPLNVLLEYCIPFVKVGGYFVAYKGPGAYEEIEGAQNALKILGAEVQRVFDVDLPYSEKTHKLIIVQKKTKTPKRFPRNPGKPKKSPL
ncbi:MAG: 16S rRNA (guanine(527)-N(7))-methyltransferase RsmG [Xylanivirga thermophila]|jgi:16S rRNA (guanine527-N7)-methyltransferase|uniref:16S rRNA (guanine(527)-N(7))-methyltransferase RsmG n=1 Tax=Xylanivirga thermophila TaxID=2496273 RepID=UPI00101E1258|nr:16S rRNA (guanine(527)-N(7))-methyltransferase RsmG [Xylanivirga thermophila]